MLAVLYRTILKEGADIAREYQQSWQLIAEYFVKHKGALGSRIHQSNDDKNLWVVYSCWPDLDTHKKAWPIDEASDVSGEVRAASEKMKACADPTAEKFDPIKMDLQGDLLFPSLKTTKKQVLIYNDEGVAPGSLQETLRSCHQVLDLDVHRVNTVDAHYVKYMPGWENSASIFIMPGGRTLPHYEQLGPIGNKRISQFVAQGGQYLGLCAGGYYGAEKTVFEKGNKPMEVLVDGPLNFFKGQAWGPAYGLGTFVYNSEAGARAAKLRAQIFANQTTYCQVYYNGGCYFQAFQEDSSVQVLAQFDDIADSPAAIVQCTHEKGRAILSGVHPEYTAHAAKLQTEVSHDMRKVLTEQNIMRENLFASLLHRLGQQLKIEYLTRLVSGSQADESSASKAPNWFKPIEQHSEDGSLVLNPMFKKK